MANIFSLFKKKENKSSVSWKDISSILEPHKKSSWFPKTVQRKSSYSSSKFSGIPIIADSEEWPCCQHCNKPMQLFVQINSDHLPKEAGKPFGNGYLQVFYCTNLDEECEVECEAFFPFSKSTLVRVVSFDSTSKNDDIDLPVKDAFPEKEIIGWEEKDDYPGWEELEELGCTLTEAQSDFLCDQEYPLPKDKLLGWPYWIQGVEYPSCPECGERMQLVFQIDSEDNLPYMFGDVGCSHVTQCRRHEDKMTIAWACS